MHMSVEKEATAKRPSCVPDVVSNDLRRTHKQLGVMLSIVEAKIRETTRTLKQLGYSSKSISPKEFYDYMTGETPTGDAVTLDDVLRNEFFMVHEVVEICELKKMNVPIDKHTIMKFYPKVYEAHLSALDFELTYALNKKAYDWFKQRFNNFLSQLDDPYLPPEFDHLKKELAPRCRSMVEKFSKRLPEPK
jgi:hypothetical protein